MFYAKIANWVKDGVPTHSANTPSAQLVLHPVSLETAQGLARDKPRLYSAARGGFPCKHLIAFLAKSIYELPVISNAWLFSHRFSTNREEPKKHIKIKFLCRELCRACPP